MGFREHDIQMLMAVVTALFLVGCRRNQQTVSTKSSADELGAAMVV